MIVTISADEYQDHDDNNDGVCIACGEWTAGGVEPDARKYTCEDCGEKKVYGTQEALINGYLEIED